MHYVSMLVITADSNPAGGLEVLLLRLLCCQAETSASGWSLVQRSPIDCGVSEGDHKTSIMRRPWPTNGCCALGVGIGFSY